MKYVVKESKTLLKLKRKMHFVLVAIIAVAVKVNGLAADSTDYNHVNNDGSFAFG